MMRWLAATALSAAALAGAGAARADLTDARLDPRVFYDADLGKAPRAAPAELTRVEKKCTYSEFSREGPDPHEVAACQAALARLVKRGPAAIPGVLAAIDQTGLSGSVRSRLYDVLARTGDVRLLEPLINGMARIATRKIDGRGWEVGMIQRTLTELSGARVGTAVPWAADPEESGNRVRQNLAVEWKLWLEDNRDRSRKELLERALAGAVADVDGPDFERAYQGASYLLEHAGADGIAAARKLAARADVPDAARPYVQMLSRQADAAERHAARARSRPPVDAPGHPSKRMPPPTPKAYGQQGVPGS